MIRIVTDSTSNLPESIIKEYGITVVPTYLHFGGETYLDGVTMSTSEFYKRLVASAEPPTTSQIPVKDFAEVYQKIGQESPGAEILSVHLSHHLSGTIESARQAAASVPGVTIQLYDTLSITLGAGLHVLEAAKLAKAGKSMGEIVGRLDVLRDGMRLFWTVETLEYLARSGRIGRAARFLGTMLDVKPILSIKNGTIDPHSRQRSRQKAIATIREMLTADCKGKRGVQLAVMHTASQQEAQQTAEELRAEIAPDVLLINELTPAVGLYAGPGMLGFAWTVAPPN